MSDREAFEKWWPSVGQTIGKVAAWEAWQAAQAQQQAQPVAPVPQDVEKFIAEKGFRGVSESSPVLIVMADDLRAWMKGHVRVPVDISEKYHELIYQVGNKHPGESRHETALRYLRQAENRDNSPETSQEKKA